MNQELVMGMVLIGMIIYFIKSSDLSKEQKERSKMLETQNLMRAKDIAQKKLNFAKLGAQKKKITINKKIEKNEIDQLSLKITSLEQELQDNMKKNSRIKNLIDAHLEQISSIENQHLH